MWEHNRGTINQTGFMRIFIDPGNTGTRVVNFVLYFRGEGGTVSRFEELPDGHIHADPPARGTISTDTSRTPIPVGASTW